MPFCLPCQSPFVSILFLLLQISRQNEAASFPAAVEPRISIENEKCILQYGNKQLNVQALHGVLLDKDGWLAKLIPSLAKKPIYLVESLDPKNPKNLNYKFTVLAAVLPAAAKTGKVSDQKALIMKAATDCAKHATNTAHKPIVDHETPCKMSRPDTDKEEYQCKLPSKSVNMEAGGKSSKKQKTISTVDYIRFRIVQANVPITGRAVVPECLIKEYKKMNEETNNWKWIYYPAFAIPDVNNKLFLLIGEGIHEGIHRIELKDLKCQKDYCLFQPLKCKFEVLHKVKFIEQDHEKSEVHGEKSGKKRENHSTK